jgi:FkbM family methyltransferase
MNYSNPLLIKARQIGQRLGILRPLVRTYRLLLSKNYEDNFDRQMMSVITTGSVVWDIGANVGLYSKKFLEKVGSAGRVVAFEPAPQSARICAEMFFDKPNYILEKKALSNRIGAAKFLAEATSVTNRIVTDNVSANESSTTIDVQEITGDSYSEANPGLCPNFIKLDVEGFEPEVLEGLRKTIEHPKFKALFLEMHFFELAKRGKASAPTEIVEFLKSGSLKIRWVDPSHLMAYR